MEDLIFGAKNAAKEIGISYRTLCRYLDREDFPKPVMEQDRAEGGKLRWWKKEDLLKFREKILQEKQESRKGKGRPITIDGEDIAKIT